MSNLDSRVKQLEKTRAPEVRIFIYYEGQDFGTYNREPMTRAEWDTLKTDKDTEIVIQYVSNYFAEMENK